MAEDRAASLPAVKRALLEVRRMRARLAEAERARSEPIAIVGMGLRFPGGAVNAESFWRVLDGGCDVIGEVPPERWDPDAYFDADPDAPGKMSTRYGGFLSDVDLFDANFFGIAPREAVSMDPQHRLVLETAWEALEDAGVAATALMDSETGVFVGVTNSDYNRLLAVDRDRLDAYYSLGTTLGVAAGRLSYLLGLRGPSLVVDTACSSSLVSVHLACQSLRSRECDLALAAGVNLILTPEISINLSKAHMMAPDGRCKTFDASADGYVRSEGCGVVVLKRLSDAVNQRDRILAVIRGSAVNQDGRSGGLTAPNGPAQEAVIRRALAAAGVQPSDIQYVETHGTGTRLGDPIEVNALANVLREGRDPARPVLIGSVKTNIGHLESAAGMAGLIKVVLSMQHAHIPRHLHVSVPNPHIAWDQLPVRVTSEPTTWDAGHRLAGVSSFGFSGTNAHVVLEQAPAEIVEEHGVERPMHVLALSARDENALRALAGRYLSRLRSEPDLAIADVCFSANAGRTHHQYRLAVPCASLLELTERLDAFVSGADGQTALIQGRAPEGQPPGVVFLFPGQGSEYFAMGRDLYETQPVFRRAIDRCDEILRGMLDRPIGSVLFDHESRGLLEQTAYTQPALFAVDYALAELWKSWGVRPAAVFGHSLGGEVAGCVAGVFSLEDGLRFVTTRGRLMQSLTEAGGMASVFASESRVRETIAAYAGEVTVAAINGPENIVISSASEILTDVLGRFEAEGLKTRRLTTQRACHSPLMDPILDKLMFAASEMSYSRPLVPIVSDITGAMVSDEEVMRPDYWCRHVRDAVRFQDGIESLHRTGHSIFLTVGPGSTLSALGRRCSADHPAGWHSSIREGRGDWPEIVATLSSLYAQGVPIDWAGFDGEYRRRKIALPTYPFQRDRYWFQATAGVRSGPQDDVAAPLGLLGRRLRSSIVKDIVFETSLSTDRVPSLEDHRVDGQPMAPAALFVELMLESAVRLGLRGVDLENLVFQAPLILAPGDARTVQTVLNGTRGDYEVRVLSAAAVDSDDDVEWTCHVTGRMSVPTSLGETPDANAGAAVRSTEREVAGRDYYEKLAVRGIDIGDRFRAISRLWVGPAEAAADLSIPPDADHRTYQVHPALFDAMCHVLGSTLIASDVGDETYLLAGIRRVRVLEPVTSDARCHATLESAAKSPRGHADLFSADGRLLLRCEGLEFRPVRRTAAALPADWVYEVTWTPLESASGRRQALDAGPAVEAASREIGTAATADGASTRTAALQLLEDLSTGYMHLALRQLGWNPVVGDAFARPALARRLGVVPRHEALFFRILSILETDGLFVEERGQCVVRRPLPDVVPDVLRARAATEFLDAAPELELTARCGAELAGVLRGDVNAMELLFPDGSLALVERVYNETETAHLFNRAQERALAAIVDRVPDGRRLRVLEIGAGTGATSSRLLPLLRPASSQYVFTDVSPVFLGRAREKFSQYRFAEYRLLNIARDPVEQGFPEHGFDVVVAANVLHATSDLRTTLQHARKLVAPGGLLLVVEAVRQLRWLDLTFGMTDGWWAGTDAALRHGHPLLASDAWTRLLVDLGFEGVTAVPGPELQGGGWVFQALLVAQAPERVHGELATNAPPAAGVWLVLADGDGVGQQFVQRAEAAGDTCVVAQLGSTAPDNFAEPPAAAEDFDRILAAVERSHLPLRGVVHCLNVDAPLNAALSGATIERIGRVECGSVLLLVQALLARSLDGPLWVITRGAHAFGDSAPSMAQAPAWGFGRVVALEHPEMWGGLIDLDPDGSSDSAAEQLWSAVHAGDGEDQVAVRGGMRYGARLTRARVDDAERVALRPEGSYLVTGGFGGLGLRAARWLVANGARHVVLASRRQLPDRERWSSLAVGSELADVTTAIVEMEQAGAMVVPVGLDVTNEAQLSALTRRFGVDLPPLRGILHLATAYGIENIRDMSLASLETMLRPKVAGTLLLEQATRGFELDFFVLFGSTTGLLGSKGLAHYAAANAFLDAFAHRARRAGAGVLSIDWGAWEIMRTGSVEQQRLFSQAGLRPMPVARGLAALGSVLGTRRPQVVVASVDWGVLKAVFETRRRRPFLESLSTEDRPGPVSARPPSSLARQLEAAREEDRHDVLLAHVRVEAAAVLALDPEQLDVERGLFDVGMDSLMSVELKSRLERSTGKKLPATLTFNYPSVAALATFLGRALLAPDAGTAAPVPSASPAQPGSADSPEDDLTDEQLEALLAEKLSQWR